MTLSLSQLKIDLKKWEYAFIAKQGREPTKDDIKKLPEVKKMYKQYSTLKKGRDSQETGKEKTHQGTSPGATPSKDLRFSLAVELGPTPQIHGKTISIFEMGLSPIKQASYQTEETTSPTSTISQADAYCSDQEEMLDVKRQLNFPAATPNSSPFKTHEAVKQVKYYGPNSPLKLDEANIELSFFNKTPKKTNFPNVSSSFSPSPLVKRPLTKSLLELVQEHVAFVEEFKDKGNQTEVNHIRNIDSSSEEAEENPEAQKTAKPRRRVLRRFALEEESDKSVKRNISDELMKLKQQHVNEFFGGNVFNEEIRETVDKQQQQKSKESITPNQVAKKKKKKYNLVSNNFRRLKLPKKNSSKRFWMRRGR